MADREPGLYWVKTIGGEDVIAEWIGNQWYVLHPSLKGMVLDHDFKEIGERVERQPTSADFTEADEKTIAQIKERMHSWVRSDVRTALQLHLAHLHIEPGCAWPKPQPITEAQKTGERFLVWHENPEEPDRHGWFTAMWSQHHAGWGWIVGADTTDEFFELDEEKITGHIPLPPDAKP